MIGIGACWPIAAGRATVAAAEKGEWHAPSHISRRNLLGGAAALAAAHAADRTRALPPRPRRAHADQAAAADHAAPSGFRGSPRPAA